MIESQHSNIGFVLFVDLEGRIIRIAYNKLNDRINSYSGKLFANILDDQSKSKMLDLLVDIKNSGATFGWELNLNSKIMNTQCYLSGLLLEGEILLIGSKLKGEQEIFLKGLMEINNEQINKIRFLEQNKNRDERSSSHLFNEISKLNNELVDKQRELNKKNVELSKLNKMKNEFLGMAAHDLRSPLGNIVNFSEFILDDAGCLSPEQLEFLRDIKSRSNYMLKLVTELLDVSNIETGAIKLNKESIDLVHHVKNIIKIHRHVADKKNIEILFTCNNDKIEVEVDPGKIEQVLSNLLTNAIKYSHHKTQVKIKLDKNENEIVLIVEDQGQGIPEDEIQLLFKPFKITSIKTTGGESSTGLGLYIVKKIVEAHEGKVEVESKFGNGSKFSVRFKR